MKQVNYPEFTILKYEFFKKHKKVIVSNFRVKKKGGCEITWHTSDGCEMREIRKTSLEKVIVHVEETETKFEAYVKILTVECWSSDFDWVVNYLIIR